MKFHHQPSLFYVMCKLLFILVYDVVGVTIFLLSLSYDMSFFLKLSNSLNLI